MRPHFNLCILLTHVLFCTASVVPRRTHSNDITPYLHSFGIPLTARQDTSCLSEEECGEGNLCAQLNGEPFCKTDCEGFCIPEEFRDTLCNCDLPCENGFCTDPLPGPDQPDNGLCSMEKDRKAFKCAEKKEEDDVIGEAVNDEGEVETPGEKGEQKCSEESDSAEVEPKPEEVKSDETESGGDDTAADTEDITDESDSTAEEEGDDGNNEARDGEEELGTPGNGGKEKEQGKMEEEKNPAESGSGTGSKPEKEESDETSSIADSPETPIPRPETETSDNTEEESSGVCISKEHLTHLRDSSLVFRNDILARVLCDTNGSCATAGHMVVFHGRGMMMRRYCEEVGCVKRVMRVNSPLYKSGLRVESRSSDLSFTALAARFGTVAEEVVLGAAVRLGL